MHLLTINIWGINTLHSMLTAQTATPKDIRRFGKVLDEIEPIYEDNKDYYKENIPDKDKAAQTVAGEVPVVQIAFEDADFEFLKKKHDEFKGYAVGARKLIEHIDQALKNTKRKKATVKDYKEGRVEFDKKEVEEETSE